LRAYTSLALDDIDSFVFGSSPHPVVLKSGLIIGGGQVYPEVNFTLPSITISADSMPKIREQYLQMATGVCTRAVEFVETMFRCFELCANAGADMLAIESTGGKEIHDDAILNGDLPASVFALGVLASRDMGYL
jgi:Methanol-cobalamin methyltransferase B subunit